MVVTFGKDNSLLKSVVIGGFMYKQTGSGAGWLAGWMDGWMDGWMG
jgi:hypothetical protein